MGTKMFDLVTLTLKFDLLLKNFNLSHCFLTRRGRAFIFHLYIPCDKTFPWVPKFLTSWPWPWSLTYFKKNFNLGHCFLTRRGRAFIFHLYILCDKTFPWEPKFFYFVTLTLKFSLFSKTLTLVIASQPEEVGLSYFTYVFLVGRPLMSYHDFLTLWPWPCRLNYFNKKLSWTMTFETEGLLIVAI